jgi:hypothetical protein
VILWFMTYRINSFADLFFFSRFEDIWFRERKNMEHIGFKIIILILWLYWIIINNDKNLLRNY